MFCHFISPESTVEAVDAQKDVMLSQLQLQTSEKTYQILSAQANFILGNRVTEIDYEYNQAYYKRLEHAQHATDYSDSIVKDYQEAMTSLKLVAEKYRGLSHESSTKWVNETENRITQIAKELKKVG